MKEALVKSLGYGGKMVLWTVYVPLKLVAIILTSIVEVLDTLRC